MRLFWGLLIVLVGLVLLAGNFSLITTDQLLQVLKLWPLILIILGVSLIFKRWWWGWIPVLLAFLLSLALASVLIYQPDKEPNIFKPTTTKSINSYSFSNDLPSNLEKARIKIDSGATNLKISRSEDKLIEGALRSSSSRPQLNVNISNNIADITFKTDKVFKGFWAANNNLEIKLTDKIPLEIILDAGASRSELDLSNLTLSGLDLNSGATSAKIKLGNVLNDSEININAGASDIEIQYPQKLGLEIQTKTGLTDKKFDQFVQVDGSVWQSPDFASRSSKAKLLINAGASSIKVNSF